MPSSKSFSLKFSQFCNTCILHLTYSFPLPPCMVHRLLSITVTVDLLPSHSSTAQTHSGLSSAEMLFVVIHIWVQRWICWLEDWAQGATKLHLTVPLMQVLLWTSRTFYPSKYFAPSSAMQVSGTWALSIYGTSSILLPILKHIWKCHAGSGVRWILMIGHMQLRLRGWFPSVCTSRCSWPAGGVWMDQCEESQVGW